MSHGLFSKTLQVICHWYIGHGPKESKENVKELVVLDANLRSVLWGSNNYFSNILKVVEKTGGYKSGVNCAQNSTNVKKVLGIKKVENYIKKQ